MHRSTVWRWLKQAQTMGLVEFAGSRKSTVWTASEDLRREILRQQINEPLAKRGLVPYQEEFLEDYVPNQSAYLSKKDLDRLHRQSPVGSAQFASLPQHDQSLFLCGLSYASSSLEGNTYDMIATEKLLLEGVEKEGAKPEETTMVINHHEAVRYLVDNINFPSRRNDVDLHVRDIKSLHGLISTNLLKNPYMCGTVRHAPVKISHSSYVPLAVHEAIERGLSTLCAKAAQINDPFEQAFFVLVHLPYLQPFEDCNKRTSRVACNIPLLRKGVVPMNWMDVNVVDYNNGLLGVYERNNTTLLSEVFVDGFMHSTERFEIMQRAAKPSVVQTKYRGLAKSVVRAIVLNGDTSFPDEVDPVDQGDFKVYIERELGLLKAGNIGALVRYNLKEGDLQEWVAESEGETTGRDRRGQTE